MHRIVPALALCALIPVFAAAQGRAPVPTSAQEVPPVMFAASIDASAWPLRKQVLISKPGVQILEPDAEVLASARADLGDLRLLCGERQLPYLRSPEAPVVRAYSVTATPDESLRRTGVTRLRLAAPEGAPPICAFSCDSDAAVFRRRVRLLNEPGEGRAGTRLRVLAECEWLRTDADTRPLRFEFGSEAVTGPLILEIENGDNAPLVTRGHTVYTRAPRLLFVAPEPTEPVMLAYGNPQAAAPDYADLRLVAARLFACPNSPAALGDQATAPQSASGTIAAAFGKRSGALLLVALTVTVLGLFVALLRMLPKPQDEKPQGGGR